MVGTNSTLQNQSLELKLISRNNWVRPEKGGKMKIASDFCQSGMFSVVVGGGGIMVGIAMSRRT